MAWFPIDASGRAGATSAATWAGAASLVVASSRSAIVSMLPESGGAGQPWS